MKRIPFAVIAVCLLALSGCGTPQQPGDTPAVPTVSDMTGAAPIDAALVTETFGWVLTPDRLFISHDGGVTLMPVDVPVPAGEGRAAHFIDASTGTVTATDGESIKVATTRNGGRTWRTTTIRGPAISPAGYSSLTISFGDQAHGAIAARAATSQAFSLATIFTTTDGGANWTPHSMPEAGVVRVEPGGRIWLAGTTLNSTTDQAEHWTRSELALAGPVTAATVTPPLAGTVPVTVLTGERTEVQLLTTTDDGRTWGRPARLPIHGRAGPGARLAVAGTPAGPVVYDNTAGHAYRRDGTDLHPSGLADGVQAVTFAADGQHGWALASSGTCAVAKQDCRYTHTLSTTTDGGATWRTAATWSHQVP